MSSPIDLRNPGRTIHVGVILMNSETEIMDVAPVDLLHGLTNSFISDLPEEVMPAHFKKQVIDVDFHWVNETGKPAKLTGGITLVPTDTFESCPPLDIALMGAHNFSYTPNETELAYIRKTFEHCHSFLTICGGMMAPLQAGILHGKRATAPRPMLAGLKRDVPGVEWLDQRYVHDGKLWMSGILLNGTDMMAQFAREAFGARNGEKEKLADFVVDLCCWPSRGVEYKEGEGSVQVAVSSV